MTPPITQTDEPVISIRKYLSLNNEVDQALVHVIRILAEGISQQAGEDDSEEYARFRDTVRDLADALTEGTAHADLLVRAGAVRKGLEEHNHRVAKHQRMQTVELQHMVKMLASTVKAVTAASDTSLSTLSDIEQRIVTASALDDVRVIKIRLADCLAEIRKDAELQQKQAAETIEQLNQGLDRARRDAAALEGDNRDEVTGLPQREEAESAIARSGQQGDRAYAAVMVLDRLQVLNARFGRDVGDEILASFTRLVRKHLAPGDRLFRWTGTALVALLPRPDGIESVRAEVGRAMAAKLEHSIQTPSRSLMVPVSARWTLFPVMAAARLICQRIDTFAAAPGIRE